MDIQSRGWAQTKAKSHEEHKRSQHYCWLPHVVVVVVVVVERSEDKESKIESQNERKRKERMTGVRSLISAQTQVVLHT